MHWELWHTASSNLVETFDSEDEGLQAVREMLAVNRPDIVDELVLGAMYDDGEPDEIELPPVLEGETLKARLAETAPVAEARAVHERIRQWVTEERWDVQDVPDDQALLNIHVKLDNGQTVSIMQSKSRPNHIDIAKQLTFGDSTRVEFSQLSSECQRTTLWSIHHDLTMLGVEFDGPGIPLTIARFFAAIYFDGLTKDRLIQTMALVLRAQSLTIWTFARALEATGEPSPAAKDLLRLVPPPTSTSGQVMAAS